MKLFKIAVSIGDGSYRIQPVYKDDLAAITVGCIKTCLSNSIIEVSGRETVSIKEVISLMENLLARKVLKVRLPVALLQPFKRFIPFDLDGYTEDKVSSEPFTFTDASFKENLAKIVNLR